MWVVPLLFSYSNQSIFTPEDWLPVIKGARKKNPFIVVEMKTENFFSSDQLQARITNRKLNSEKAKVEWLKMQWIQVSREQPYIMKYKYSNNEDVCFYEVNVAKRAQVPLNEPLDLLFPEGRSIDKPKLADLKDLMPFIPPIHHQFYTNLSSGCVQDYGLCGDLDENDF